MTTYHWTGEDLGVCSVCHTDRAFFTPDYQAPSEGLPGMTAPLRGLLCGGCFWTAVEQGTAEEGEDWSPSPY
jgi:hypothetical protein